MLSFHKSEKKNEHLRKVPFPTDKCGCHRDILIYDANPLKANLAYKVHSTHTYTAGRREKATSN